MNELLIEIVEVDVENITTLEELKNISAGNIAVFSDREDDEEELVIKNDRGEKNSTYGYLTTISKGDFNGVKETSYF